DSVELRRRAALAQRHEVRKPDGVAGVVAYGNIPEIIGTRAVFATELADDVVLFAIEDEIAESLPRQCGLQSLGDVPDRNAERLRSGPIDAHLHLRLAEFQVAVDEAEQRAR